MGRTSRQTTTQQERVVPHVLLTGGPGLLVDALRLALETEKMDVDIASDASPAAVSELLAAAGGTVVVIPDRDADITVELVSSVVEAGSLAVTITLDSETVDSARFVDAGASFIVGRNTSYEALARVIEKLSAGKPTLPLDRRYKLEQKLRDHRRAEARRRLVFEELSKRERVVFGLIYEGLSAEQIAEEECVSISTVRTHIRNILTKLNVHSQLAAVAMARSHGWFVAESVGVSE